MHSLRNCHDGVLIGISTLLLDKPRLNVREVLPGITPVDQEHQPSPIILDSTLKILDIDNLKVLRPVVLTTVFPGDERYTSAQAKIEAMGGKLVSCRRDIQGR